MPGAAERRWWCSLPALMAAAAVEAAALVPFHHLATEDGPTNVASAHIIATYPGAYRAYFTLDYFPKFDMLWQLVLALAAHIVPTLVAERVMLVFLVVALPAAGWYAVRGIRPAAGAEAFLLLPLAIGYFFHAGYHSFCAGLALFFVAIGWWARHRDASRRATAVLAALLVVTYLAHVVAAAMAIGVIFVVALWERYCGLRRPLWPIALASAPVVALVIAYLARGANESGTSRLGPVTLAKDLVSLRAVLASYDGREAVVALAVGVVLVAAVVATLWRSTALRHWRDPANAWTVAIGAVVVVYFAAPNHIGSGSQVNERLGLFVVLITVLWLAGAGPPRRVAAGLVIASVGAALALTALHLPKYAAFDRDLNEYTSVGAQLRAGATVVPVNLVQPTDDHAGLARSKYVKPVIQASGYLVDERDVVDLSQFNGQFTYFTTQFRPSVDPFRFIGAGKNWLGDSPPVIDLLGYERATHGRGRIDFVLVWGAADADAAVTSSAAYRSLEDQLARGYELVFTSDRGHAQLYRRR